MSIQSNIFDPRDLSWLSPVLAKPYCPYAPELVAAAVRGDIQSVRRLLEKGAYVDSYIPNISHSTPLASAAYPGYDKIVEVLLKAGASVDKTDRQGRSALFWTRSGVVIKMLIASGTDPFLKDKEGNNFLVWRVLWNPEDIEPEILKPLKLEQRQIQNQLPRLLSQKVLPDLAKIILGYIGENNIIEKLINERTSKGLTPLYSILNTPHGFETNCKWAKMLIDYGANIYAKTPNGRETILDYVRRTMNHGYKPMRDIFEKAELPAYFN